jgi:exodeoxyribonuclease-5
MRQAQESAIIRLSMHIREGKDFRVFPTVSGEVRIIPRKVQFRDEDITLLQASQVICGTNAERNRLNQRIRQLQGRGPEPEIGDKIIGLDNHWNTVSIDGENALTNGAIGSIDTYELELQDHSVHRMIRNIEPVTLMRTNFTTDDGDTFEDLPIDYKCLTTGEPSLTMKEEALIAKYQKITAASGFLKPKRVPYHFNYGYAITCWKAQGSEYPYVLGYDCTWLKKKDKEEYIKYLYTLVTRASQAVILVGD